MDFFSVNNTMFTFWDYQMSYIEFFGTLLNIACVFLLVKKNIWNWIIGNMAVILFASLFYQVSLYADLFEQVFFFITGAIGYFMWRQKVKEDTEIQIRSLTTQNWMIVILIFGVGTANGFYIITNLNDWLPNQFPTEASYPLLDTATTVASFIATVLMMKRFLQNWYLWIAVDIIGIWLYWQKDVPFISALYVVFLGLAISGAFKWDNTYYSQQAMRDWEAAVEASHHNARSSGSV